MIYSVNQKYEPKRSIQLKDNKQNSNQKQQKNVTFERALTRLERKDLKQLITKVFEKIGIKENVMVIHSPSFAPKFSYELKAIIDKGIGSSCDEGFKRFLHFVSDVFGTTGLQLGPETKVTQGHHSPYSHGAFSLSEHLISPVILKNIGLISQDTLKAISKTSAKTEEGALNVDYNHYFEVFPKLMEEAYASFKALAADNALKTDFSSYLKLPQIKPWLEKEAIFHNVLGKEHKTKNIFEWPELDKKLNLYLNDPSHPRHNEAVSRLNEIKTKFAKDIELFELQQFLIHRQKMKSKKTAEKLGQTLMGDVKIGNGINDLWAFPKAFVADLEKNTYATIGAAKGHDWGVFALNHESDAALNFLELKIDNMFLHHHGTRLDAAFAYVEPFLTHHQKEVGKPTQTLSCDQVYQGDALIKTIKKAIIKNKIPLDLIAAENLGTESQIGRARKILKESGILEMHNFNPAVATSQSGGYGYGYGYGYGGYGGYGEYGYGPEFIKYLRKEVPPEISEPYSRKWFVGSSHDTDTLINLTRGNREMQKEILVQDFYGPSEKNQVWRKQFAFMDAFGIKQRYNSPELNGKGDNWLTRLPQDYEELYYRNIANPDPEKQKGYNLPEILLEIIKRKGLNKNEGDKELINGLTKYKNILLEQRAYKPTEAELLEKTAAIEKAEKAEKEAEAKIKPSDKKSIIKKLAVATGITGALAYIVHVLNAKKAANTQNIDETPTPIIPKPVPSPVPVSSQPVKIPDTAKTNSVAINIKTFESFTKKQ